MFKNHSKINKFILVLKEQFEQLKEYQISDSGGSVISEIGLDSKNETSEFCCFQWIS